VLPFRYVAAARVVPQLEPEIDSALLACISGLPDLPGQTAILVDVSGSMDERLSGKADLKRIDAAAALASVVKGNRRIFTFSQQVVECPPRYGMAGIDTIIRSQPHGGTYLGQAMTALNTQVPYDRVIVITDEQSADAVPPPKGKGYMINVASAENGVGYRNGWNHIDGFSENVIRWIAEHESSGI
jgi:60 kDa SS-A/Ro ribonucleoprotein